MGSREFYTVCEKTMEELRRKLPGTRVPDKDRMFDYVRSHAVPAQDWPETIRKICESAAMVH